MFKLSVAVLPDILTDFQQTPVEGVYWKYFFSISWASKRTPWLMDDFVIAVDGPASNLSTVMTMSEWERFSNSAQNAGGRIK